MDNAKFTRRVFIKGAALSVTALALKVHSMPGSNVLEVLQNGQYFDKQTLTLLSDIAEIMIPRTHTPGAIDAQVPAVIDGLMNTWASDTTKRWFEKVFDYINKQARAMHHTQYLKLTIEQRSEIIEQLDEQAFSKQAADISEAYRHLKYLVFRVYYTSQEADQPHVPIPGSYSGKLTLAQYDSMIKERAYG